MQVAAWILSLTYIATVLLPIWNTGHWWVRALDFPRLQALFIGLAAIAFSLAAFDHRALKVPVLLVLAVCIGIDLYRIGPYLPIMKKESKAPPVGTQQGQFLKTLSVNVWQGNKNYEDLIRLIHRADPDIVAMVETDPTWIHAMEPLQDKFTDVITVPHSNTYGMMLWSKFPVHRHEVKYLVEDAVPSIFATVAVGDREIDLIVLHPKPPRPSDGPSDERDLELLIVAEGFRNDSSRPTIVLGDLNDVAWSHTTRTFLEVSGLLDPRKGRGFFATFPAKVMPLRFPIDHIFHSNHFFLADIQVYQDVGSDHLPLGASFVLSADALATQKPKPLDEDAVRDAEEIKERVQSSH